MHQRFSSVGTANVGGPDSRWSISGRLGIGGDVAFGNNGGTGTLNIDPGGTVSGAAQTVLFPDGLLRLQGGTLATSEIDLQGGQFQWTSGTLHIGLWHSNLTTPSGGTLAPGRSDGITTIEGNYTQSNGGSLKIEIGGTAIGVDHDFVNVTGSAILAGELQLKLLDDFTIGTNDAFTVLNASGGIAGTFSNAATGQRLTTADNLGSFLVHYGGTSPFNPNQIVLTAFELEGLPGDYNADSVVNAADYTVWRDHLGSGTSLLNDDTPGVGPDDYAR